MKRAKIVLTAITVLAIAGGALALRTKGNSVVYSVNTATNLCTVLADPNFLIDPSGPAFNVTTNFGAAAPCGPTHGFSGSISLTR